MLEYNDPDGVGGDPKKIEKCRRSPTVNNMNYDNVVNCQDYALLFYALCKHYDIECKLVVNVTLLHAYNQVYRAKKPVDIEPQSNEHYKYIKGLHGYEQHGVYFTVIRTRSDNILVDIDEWNKNPHTSAANMELFNYVVEHGHLPNQKMKEYPVEDLFVGNYVGIISASCGYNIGVTPRKNKFATQDRMADQMIFDMNYLDVRKASFFHFSYSVGADLSIGARLREINRINNNIFMLFPLPSFEKGTTSTPSFSSRLSVYALVGFTLNYQKTKVLKDMYFSSLVGIGVSISVFGKDAFSSFYVAYSFGLQYFFSRNYGMSFSIAQTYDAAFFNRYGSNFMIKIGPCIRLHGQPYISAYSKKRARELEMRVRKQINEMRGD